MARPKKCRLIGFLPETTVFKPAGVPRCELEEIVVSIEELEAIRLRDREGLAQAECAQRMAVSRPTYQRILRSARQKVARMLTEGLSLRVEGGDYRFADDCPHGCPNQHRQGRHGQPVTTAAKPCPDDPLDGE